jgi:carboxymethylenebutenolidase
MPQQTPDSEIIPISRTIGNARVIGELIYGFTHTIEMEWLLPGIPPTGRRVEIPIVVVQFLEGKIVSEQHLLGPGLGAGPGGPYRPRRAACERC